jgi:N-acetylglucosaminyl-diphospho-decaprenol L-rhamnosyltransferase
MSRSLTAIVVYFRTPERLDGCLEALRGQTHPPDQIVVVDNSSALDQLDQRPADGDDWGWVRADRNLGFGAACNLGAQAAMSDYLLFLNADLVLGEAACEFLCAAADTDLRIGVVGPRIYGADGRIELSARAFPGAATGLLGRSSLLTKLFSAVNRTPSAVSRALGASGYVDWVSGACMLLRRSAFEEVDGFDATYWMYWEDADICRRLMVRGWRTMLCTDAEATHTAGSSGRTEQTIEAFHASAIRYYERHVARAPLAAALARSLLHVRMRIMLRRHARRLAS